MPLFCIAIGKNLCVCVGGGKLECLGEKLPTPSSRLNPVYISARARQVHINNILY